jgi:hypothetical protein
MPLILTLLAIVFSTLMIMREIATNVLLFKPESYKEDTTHDLAVRLAFNRGPLMKGSEFGLLLLTLFIGLSRGAGYNFGLDIIEWFAARSQPGSIERWKAEE